LTKSQKHSFMFLALISFKLLSA